MCTLGKIKLNLMTRTKSPLKLGRPTLHDIEGRELLVPVLLVLFLGAVGVGIYYLIKHLFPPDRTTRTTDAVEETTTTSSDDSPIPGSLVGNTSSTTSPRVWVSIIIAEALLYFLVFRLWWKGKIGRRGKPSLTDPWVYMIIAGLALIFLSRPIANNPRVFIIIGEVLLILIVGGLWYQRRMKGKTSATKTDDQKNKKIRKELKVDLEAFRERINEYIKKVKPDDSEKQKLLQDAQLLHARVNVAGISGTLPDIVSPSYLKGVGFLKEKQPE
jgi:hypothetical protein